MFDEYENYKESLVGIIVDVDYTQMTKVRDSVATFVDKHLEQPFVFVYNGVCEEIPINKGASVARVLNLKDSPDHLDEAILRTIAVINAEENESKVIFVVTNQKFNEYRCQRSIYSDRDEEIDIKFFSLGSFNFTLDNVDVIQSQPDSLLKDMVKFIDPNYEWPKVDDTKPVKKPSPFKKRTIPKKLNITTQKISRDDLNVE